MVTVLTLDPSSNTSPFEIGIGPAPVGQSQGELIDGAVHDADVEGPVEIVFGFKFHQDICIWT